MATQSTVDALERLPEILRQGLDRNLCTCNEVMKIDVIEAIVNGATTLDAVKIETFAADGNGCCTRQVERLIECLCEPTEIPLQQRVEMEKRYTVIETLVEQGNLSTELAERAISTSRKSGKPSLFHLINECDGSPDDVAGVLQQMGQQDGNCLCPKCDGSGTMLFGKGDGSCHLCKQQGSVPLVVAFQWLDNNRCIPGF